MKYKIKRRRKVFKTWYILVILIAILVVISTSYALWSTTLYINGTVSGTYEEPKLPVEIPSQGTDSNGVNRYTSNVDMIVDIGFMQREVYTVQSEEYNQSENKITTTIKQSYVQVFLKNTVTAEITLQIPNNTSSDFINGQISLTESNDTAGILSGSWTGTLSDNNTISAGGVATVAIQGSLKAYTTVASNTYFNFTISYEVGGVTYYFYYNLVFVP